MSANSSGMEAWRYVLVSLEPGRNTPPAGHEIVGDKSFFSKASCAEGARLIAQAMFIRTGAKYGFRSVKVDYEPPDLDAHA